MNSMTVVSKADEKLDLRLRAISRSDACLATQPQSLAEIQSLFQRAITEGDGKILNSLCDNTHTTRDVLLGVYQHAYRARLIDILSEDYACLRTVMGKMDFRGMADAYITAHPSSTPNVRWFGSKLASFLETAPTYRAQRHFAEIAALEAALADAFDASDDPVLSLSDLRSVQPEDWARLIFKRHASSTHLRFTHNIYEIWQAHQSDSKVIKVRPLEEAQHLIVWRKDETVRVRAMSAEEAMMWQEASCGTPFGQLCEGVATFDDPESAAMRTAQYLQSWVEAELLSSCQLMARGQR